MRRSTFAPRASGFRLLAASLALAFAAACGGKPAPAPAAVPVAAAPAPAPAATGTIASGSAASAAGDDTAPSKTEHPALTKVDVATGKRGAVTSAEQHATAVGRAVLERGGNAVDAAVAVGFALGVTHPTAANIGGGGFMTIRMADGKATVIDFREVAPGKATANMFVDDKGNVTLDRVRGPRAAGISGDVAGFAMAH